MSVYEQHFEISSHDVDPNNNARPSIIVRYMQETANHHMRDRRPTYYELFREGKSYILTRLAFEVHRQLHPYDAITVKTWVSGGKGATFLRSFIVECEGEVAVEAYSEWAVVDRTSGRLCRTDEIDVSQYESGEPNQMQVPVRFRFPKELEFCEVGEKRVLYSECDMNMHMNNTYYEDMVWSHIPDVEQKKVTSFSIRFMSEAVRGAVIKIEMAELPIAVEDGCGAEETFCFLTTVDGRNNTEIMANMAKIAEDDMWTVATKG